MGLRHQAREQVLQILYLMDMASLKSEEALTYFFGKMGSSNAEELYVREMIQGLAEKKAEVDQLIESCSEHWKLSRMPRIDRNILRISTFEMHFRTDIPAPVSIDEAVELGKKYGEEKTAAFVNGLLDRISKEVKKA